MTISTRKAKRLRIAVKAMHITRYLYAGNTFNLNNYLADKISVKHLTGNYIERQLAAYWRDRDTENGS